MADETPCIYPMYHRVYPNLMLIELLDLINDPKNDCEMTKGLLEIFLSWNLLKDTESNLQCNQTLDKFTPESKDFHLRNAGTLKVKGSCTF